MQGTPAKTIFLFGRPGSGKGTQAKLLANTLGWSVFSTGDKFKQIRDEDSAIGKRVREAYDAGALIPDWFPAYLFEATMLGLNQEQGVVCEGFPRTLTQAELTDEILTWLARPYAVLHLAVGEEEALARMLKRAEVEHRPDSDDEAKVRARFDTYRTQTEPVLDFFKKKGVLIEIDGEQTPEKIAEDIRAVLKI
jgi:adenylate kinase